MQRALERFIRDERGLETVEYAILAGLIVAGLVGVVLALRAFIARSMRGLRADTVDAAKAVRS